MEAGDDWRCGEMEARYIDDILDENDVGGDLSTSNGGDTKGRFGIQQSTLSAVLSLQRMVATTVGTSHWDLSIGGIIIHDNQ